MPQLVRVYHVSNELNPLLPNVAGGRWAAGFDASFGLWVVASVDDQRMGPMPTVLMSIGDDYLRQVVPWVSEPTIFSDELLTAVASQLYLHRLRQLLPNAAAWYSWDLQARPELSPRMVAALGLARQIQPRFYFGRGAL